jgi:hypothetical protein
MSGVQGPRVPRLRDAKAIIGWRYGPPIIVKGGKGVKLSICMPKRYCAHSARPLPPEPVEGILWHGQGERSCDGATDVDLRLDGRASPCSWVNLYVSCRDEARSSSSRAISARVISQP